MRLQPLAMLKDAIWLRNVETVAQAYIEYMDKQDPEFYKGFSARVKG